MRSPSSPLSFAKVLDYERALGEQATRAAIRQIARHRSLAGSRPQSKNGNRESVNRPDEWPIENINPMQCLCCGRLLTMHKLTERCY